MKRKAIPSKTTYQCLKCGKGLSSEEKPCLNCSSPKRRIILEITDTISTHDQLRTKNKKHINGKMKVVHEQKIGDDFYKKTQQWNFIHRVLNHLSDTYYELIIDKQTGQFIEKKERLSEHIGYGSAKYKKK
jgi:hypothetical protein